MNRQRILIVTDKLEAHDTKTFINAIERHHAHFSVITIDNFPSRKTGEALDYKVVTIICPSIEKHILTLIHSRLQNVPILVFTRKCTTPNMQSALECGVTTLVIDGIEQRRVNNLIQLTLARFNGTQMLKDKLRRAQRDLKTRKIIEQAKGLLMKHRNIDEEKAYRTLRELAMNQNCKIVDVANSLIHLIRGT